MNDEHSSMAMSSISHSANMAGHAIQNAAAAYEHFSILLRPKLTVDGNQWCALYGSDLQDGVCGFGDSPALALEDFDKSIYAKLAKKESAA